MASTTPTRRGFLLALLLALLPGGTARTDAGYRDLPQPSQSEVAERIAGDGGAVGPAGVPCAGDGSARARRTAAAPVSVEGGLPRGVPPRPPGLLLPLQRRNATAS